MLQALVVTWVVVAAGRPVLATVSARLVYQRGPGAQDCAGEDAVHAAVSARLGYDPFLANVRDTLRVEIQRHGRQVQAEVRLLDGDDVERGARELSVATGDCTALIEALGLTISLTMDPGRLAMASPAPPASPALLVPPPSPAPTPPPAAPEPTAALDSRLRSSARQVSLSPAVSGGAATRPAPRAWSMRVGLAAVAALTGTPAPSGGLSLFSGVVSRALSLDVELRADAPATGDSDAPPIRIRSWRAGGMLVPCVAVGPAFACPVFGAGVMGASGRNVTTTQDARAVWSAAGGRVGVQWQVASRLSVRVHAELLETLTRNRLEVDGVLVYRLPPRSASLAGGLAWRFP